MSDKRKKIVVLTGAGISAESGIATFRDAQGLWNNYKIDDVATPRGWLADKKKVLEFYNERRKEVSKAEPNLAHLGLVDLEENYDVYIITQNIDDLHERAGSTNVLHLHGEIMKSRSTRNPEIVLDCPGDINIGDKCPDGSQLRPFVVWFGESVPLISDAENIISECDYVVVIGTSLQVFPAAGLMSCAPSKAITFIIDPSIPEIKESLKDKIIKIEMSATEGVEELKKQLAINEEVK